MVEVALKGRGAIGNPKNRFETLEVERDEEVPGPEWIETELLRDTLQVGHRLQRQPGRGFRAPRSTPTGAASTAASIATPARSMSIWASRPGSISRAASWSRRTPPSCSARSSPPRSGSRRPLAMSGVTDCYQPAERRLEITRRCLAVLAEFRNPVGDHHQERAGDAGHRHPPGAQRAPGRRRHALDHHARPRGRPQDGAARLPSAGPAEGDRAAGRGRHPGRRDGGAGRAGDHRPRDAEDPRSRGRRRRAHGGLRGDAPARGGRRPLRALARGALPGPQGKGAEPHPRPARRTALRPPLRQPHAGEGLFADQIRATFQTFKRRYGLDQPFPELSIGAFRRPGQVEQLGLFG